MKCFTEFAKMYQAFKISKMMGMTESIGRSPDEFIRNIDYSMENCKIFRIDDDTKKLLLMTELPKLNSHLKLPFPFTFVDVEFTKKDIEDFCGTVWLEVKGIKKVGIKRIVGLMISRGQMFTTKTNEVVGDNIRMTISTVTDTFDIWFDTFYDDINITDEKAKDLKIEKVSINPKIKDLIYHFTIAFINFINNPEIEIIENQVGNKQNIKRISKGKIPIPINYCVRVTGKLKIYLDDLKKKGLLNEQTFNYRFWVRGHFRTLKSEIYGENIGKRIWILPYIKGQGLLIEKEYFVKTEKK